MQEKKKRLGPICFFVSHKLISTIFLTQCRYVQKKNSYNTPPPLPPKKKKKKKKGKITFSILCPKNNSWSLYNSPKILETFTDEAL
jgi:hypothetical protein